MNFLVELIVSEYTANAIFEDYSLIKYSFQNELGTENVELAVIVAVVSTANPIIKVTCFTTRTGTYTEAVKSAWEKTAEILRSKVSGLVMWNNPRIWFCTGSPVA